MKIVLEFPDHNPERVITAWLTVTHDTHEQVVHRIDFTTPTDPCAASAAIWKAAQPRRAQIRKDVEKSRDGTSRGFAPFQDGLPDSEEGDE